MKSSFLCSWSGLSRSSLIVACLAIGLFFNPASAQTNRENDEIAPNQVLTVPPVTISTAELTAAQFDLDNQRNSKELPPERRFFAEFAGPNRENLLQNPMSTDISEYPVMSAKTRWRFEQRQQLGLLAPQPIGLSFDAATGPTETGTFPPDAMGAVGPSQVVAFLTGRLRSFNKSTGIADGVLNINPDVFFASVTTPAGSGATTITADPQIRYDRLSGRWFLMMNDVTFTSTGVQNGNRILIAVSDASSSAALTAGTNWSFYFFVPEPTGTIDFPSIGIDANALYIGVSLFTSLGSYNGTKGFVIPKAPLLTGTLGIIYGFSAFSGASTAGPYQPRGVDNPDPNNTGVGATGYFVGVDGLTTGRLTFRRVTNPAAIGGGPSVSANIFLTVPSTIRPNRVAHLGNTGGANGELSSIDDRLCAAVMRNGRLWTAHNIRVGPTGVASSAAEARNGVRWYEIGNLDTTPALVQAGTVYDNAATLASAQQYWTPSISVNGQGHAALGASTAGTNFRINAITTGRLAGDTLGTMRDGPGQITPFTFNSAFSYNPPGDVGSVLGRRWGDYSFTAVDPLDDMTMWTFQEYNNGTNTYGVRVAQLLAPPPASISDGPNAGFYNVATGQPSVNVTITGMSVGGSGFFDPGPNLGGGARPFRHLTATVSGPNVVVNSVTYNSPTSITLNLNTVGATLSDPLVPATLRDLTITNPDGQSTVRSGILNLVTVTAAPVLVAGRISDTFGQSVFGARVSLTDFSGAETTVVSNSFGYYRFENVRAGQSYLLTVRHRRRQFGEMTRVVEVTDSLNDVNFTFAAE